MIALYCLVSQVSSGGTVPPVILTLTVSPVTVSMSPFSAVPPTTDCSHSQHQHSVRLQFLNVFPPRPGNVPDPGPIKQEAGRLRLSDYDTKYKAEQTQTES